MDLIQEKKAILKKLGIVESTVAEISMKLNKKGIVMGRKQPKKASIKKPSQRRKPDNRRMIKASGGCGGCRRGK